MRLKPGDYLQNRYEILSLIGTGGMSEVYKARCHVLNRFVAIKVLKEEYSEDEDFVKRFKQEARTASALSYHPNIVSIFDVVDENHLHYIVMELVDGVTLKNYIKNKGRLGVKEAIGIAIQAAQGIAAAHDQHIVHRDIKPQNIMISRDGKVKVADFGIAREVTSQTTGTNAVGSVHYISPEQARGQLADARSDIYSLGITMYEMVTGQTPFNADTPVAVALAHLEKPVTPPRRINPEVTPSLDRIIMRCTEKKPEDRYQDANALIADLRYALVDPEDSHLHADAADWETKPKKTPRAGQLKNAVEEERAKVRRKKQEEISRLRDSRHGKPKDSDAAFDHILTGVGIFAAVLIVIVIVVIGFRLTGIFSGFSGGQGSSVPAGVSAASDGAGGDSAAFTVSISDSSDESSDADESSESGTGALTDLSGLGLAGMDTDAAKKLLTDKGFTVTVEEENSDTVPQGKVIRYSPAQAEEGGSVTLTSSLGPAVAKVTVPSITGMSPDEAKQVLESVGLTLGEGTKQSSRDVAEGLIITHSVPSGTEADKGSSVNYVVSTGKNTHYVAAVDDTISLQAYLGPSAGNTSLTISVVMKQVVNGENVTRVIMEPTDMTGNTSLPVHYSIEGADGVSSGELDVLDLTNDKVLKSYTLRFIEVDR